MFFFLEIAKVRASLFQINGVKKEPLQLPEPDGVPVTLNEKVYVPIREHPDVSTVRLLKKPVSLSDHMIDVLLKYFELSKNNNSSISAARS